MSSAKRISSRLRSAADMKVGLDCRIKCRFHLCVRLRDWRQDRYVRRPGDGDVLACRRRSAANRFGLWFG